MYKLALNKDNPYQYIGFSEEIPPGISKSLSISILNENKKKKGKKNIDIAIFNIDGKFYAISNSCIHKGGPLSKGYLEGHTVTCPWHGWKYSVRNGKSPHQGGDSVNSYKVKVVNGKLYVNPVPFNKGKKVYKPHQAYSELETSVNNYLIQRQQQQQQKSVTNIIDADDDDDTSVKSKIRILGISTTNANDKIAPRKSTSETALKFALDYSRNKLNVETIMIKLRELEFKDCEGYYSKNANACIFPCSISEMDKEDQMIIIYEKMILWADIVLIATPIRWGSASSLYYKMIQRLNCVQNQIITHNKFLIRDKIAAFIITGGQDNVQHVAGELMTFWSQLGFVFGKFPFVGWTRGWYSEDTENNYDKMTADSIVANNKILSEKTKTKRKTKDSSSNIFYQDIIKTMISAIEMSMLIKRHRYDENVMTTYNTIKKIYTYK